MILLSWFCVSAISLLLAFAFGGELAILKVMLIAVTVMFPLAYYDINH